MTAAILSGGKGTRFIPHKGLLNFGGKSIIKAQIEELRGIFDDVIIVANEPSLYNGLGADIITDIITDKGPLGGIYTVLARSQSQYNFIIGADMPYVNAALIKYMRDESCGYDIIVPEFKKNLEPLYAFYSKNCLGLIGEELKKNNLRIKDLFFRLKTKIITQEEVAGFDPGGLAFSNINTREDYERFIDRQVRPSD